MSLVLVDRLQYRSTRARAELKNLAEQHPYEGEIHEKVMLSVWWGVHGIYRSELLPDNTTATAEVYCAQLQRLSDKIRKEHSKLDKHHLEEKRYDDRDHLENDLRTLFASKSPEFYAKGICDLVIRWQKVIDVDGDYFVE
ncbi:hypothetical protein RB195_022707 [Necator americanus]|uniref:Uncharacterized protein n=1 Tax=Necator americanus TaxID=51031 RepID=A0ABR1EGB5_NECAM